MTGRRWSRYPLSLFSLQGEGGSRGEGGRGRGRMNSWMLWLHVLRYNVYTISDATVVIGATLKPPIMQCLGGPSLIKVQILI